ncbi:HU family DNA-binding protein [Paracoccus nototheniae]|uniref:HU family DNA-binding protein n=1 Tax=Paracoccus nototheniae TaxID=2489002 RepID=A0ABW4DXG0_9RHOB|nr:HU family DNA-binding protein [Paracoccus nototheniae]
MVRSELVRKVTAANPHLSPLAVEAAIDAILSEIMDVLARGSRVELRGFGSFASKDRDARMGRNPRNGASVPVVAKRIARFKASKRLQERLNGKG